MIRNMWILRRNLLKEIKDRNLNKGQSQIRNAPKVPPGRRVTTPQNPPQSGPPQSGQASEPEINPPQSGQGSEPGKTHPRVVKPQSLRNPPQSGPSQNGLAVRTC